MTDNHLIDNRQIRVFISSTFQDMQDERDYLMKHTFPVLRKMASERDVTLAELDLRWGITEEEAKSGKVVEICLREIDNCIPFFIGIIGNRYGWVPQKKDIGENVTDRFNSVNNYLERHLSVTEMEMQFGVLEREEDMHAYFYILEENEKSRQHAIDNPEMLERLKKEVKASRYPSTTYSSPEDLGIQVQQAFTSLLDQLFPEGNLSELEKERIGQRSFMNQLCQNYIRDDHNIQVLDDWLKDWSLHQMVVTGESGLGKSALIANWLKEKLQDENRDYNIIYHFIGNGGSTSSFEYINKLLSDEISDQYGWENNSVDTNTKLADLIMRVASDGNKPLLIVLDATNQLLDTNNAKLLNWLPVAPRNVKMLFSTLENDRTMEVFRSRNYPIFTLQPLDIKKRIELVNGYLYLFAKKLTPQQVNRIVSDSQCENTLVLKTLLDELINFGVFEKLNERIEYYLGQDSIDDFYQTLLESLEKDFGVDFIKKALSTIHLSYCGLDESEIINIIKVKPIVWSQFYCAFSQHLTTKNGLLYFAHSNISNSVFRRYILNQRSNKLRRDIIKICSKEKSNRHYLEIGHQLHSIKDHKRLHDHLLQPYVFMGLYKEDEQSLIKYWRYLLSNNYSLLDYFSLEKKYDNVGRLFLKVSGFCNNDLSLYDEALEFGERCLQLDDNTDNSDFRQRTLLALASIYENRGDYLKCIEYLSQADGLTNDIELEISVYNNLANAYTILGRIDKAFNYYYKSLKLDLDNNGEESSGVATCYNNIGNLHKESGNYAQAIYYVEKATMIDRTISGNNSIEYATSCNSLGVIHLETGEFEKAIYYFEQAKSIYEDYYGEEHETTALLLNNLGFLYSEKGDHDVGIELCKKALNIRQSIFGEKHPDIAVTLNNLGIIYERKGNSHSAIEYVNKSLWMRFELLGKNHKDVGFSYNSLGSIYSSMGDYRKAIEMYKKAIRIIEKSIGHESVYVGISLSNIASAYKKTGNYKKAIEYDLKALPIYISSYGETSKKLDPIYYSISTCLFKLGNYDEAIAYMNKNLEICKNNYGEFSMGVLFAWNLLSKIYRETNNTSMEITCLENVMRIGIEILGKNHKDLEPKKERLKELLKTS